MTHPRLPSRLHFSGPLPAPLPAPLSGRLTTRGRGSGLLEASQRRDPGQTRPRQTWVRSFLVLLSGLFAACAPPELPVPPTDGAMLLNPAQYVSAQAQAREQLQQLYGARVRLRTDGQRGTVAFLEAAAIALPDGYSASSSLTSFVMAYRSLFGVLDEDDLKSVGTTTDVQGLTHVRLVQLQDGVPIWGSVLVGHLDARGLLLHLHARLFGLHLWPSAPSAPMLKAEDARQQALAVLRTELPTLSATADTPVLYFLPGDQRFILVYRVEVAGQVGDDPLRLALFVNAHTGEIIHREDRVARIDVTVPAIGHGQGVLGDHWELAISHRGTSYPMQDPTRGQFRTTTIRSGEKLSGRTVTTKDPEVWDDAGQSVDVHANLQLVWDYFATQHQRFGWNGKGTGIVAVTHLGTQAPLALFDGERLLFGDGDGTTLLPTGAALDLVAHEYGHAVARSTADLASSGESGALDEGLADLWGCLVEQTMDPMRGNWTLGERILVANQPPHPKSPPDALRDLADPLRTGQVRSLAGYVAVSDELADVATLPAGHSLLVRDAQHKNAGIAAHAGYQLAQRIGNPPTAAIVYRALTTYLHRYAGFSDAADAMTAAARDLYGDGAQVTAVTASWATVGVSGLTQ